MHKRIAALAARSGDEILIEAQAFAHQARDAVVRVGAGVHAGVAARAILQIEHQQALRFHQALREELIERHAVHHLQALLILRAALVGDGLQALAHGRETLDHLAEIVVADAHHFDVIERGARGGADAAAEQADFAEIIAAREIGEDQFAAGIVLRKLSRSRCAPDRSCRRDRPGGRSPGPGAKRCSSTLSFRCSMKSGARSANIGTPRR